MKYKNMKKISTIALLIQGAFICQSAQAIEKTVEITGLGVTHDSGKFGEYTGLNDTNVDGNFQILGGNFNEDPSLSGNTRWSLTGSDLGTTSRSLNAKMSEQGKWKLNVGYDELRHNISDSYQTPMNGEQGGNSFKIPDTFGTLNGASVGGTGARTLSASQLSMFHTEKVGTTRHTTTFGSNYVIKDNMNIQFDYNHLEQTGAKLVGASGQGGINTPTGTATTDQWKAEAVSIIMNPTKYKNDTFDLAFNWNNDNGRLAATYFGSIFKDEFNSVSWESNITNTTAGMCATATCKYEFNSMSTAPGNSYHQVGLNGSYNLPYETKFTSGLSYGIGTQNDTYLSGDLPQTANGGGSTTVPTMQTNGLPATSLDGKIVQTHVDLKFINTTVNKLQLIAAAKYNRRDNSSPSKYYKYYNLGGTVASKQYTGINNPYSNYKTETELSGDYRLTSAQKIRLAYETEKYKRWCKDAAHGLECVGSTGSFENKIKLDYRINATDDIKVTAGYGYGKRTVEDVLHYMTPIGSEATIQASQMDGKDILGFVSLPFAARNEHQLKSGVTWQFNEKLDFGFNASYILDKFESTIGVNKIDNTAANLDATYAYNDNNTFTSYLSYQTGDRNMHNAKNGSTTTIPTQFWDNQLKDDSASFGIVTKHSGLLGGKMEVSGDLSYSLDQTKISTQVPYDATCSAATNLSCGNLPTIKDSRITLKLNDNYQINKNSKVSLGYVFEKRHVEDYLYNGYQYGATPVRILPTNEQAPSYTVSLFTVSYAYTF